MAEKRRFRGERREGVVAPWWRWTAYEIRHGIICPADGAELQRYDPWEHYTFNPKQKSQERYPYLELVNLVAKADSEGWEGADLTEKQTVEICDWCAANGLPGVLPHRVEHVFLAPRWARPMDDPDAIEAFQVSFHRKHRWETMRISRPGSGGPLGAEVEDQRLVSAFEQPGVFLRDLVLPRYRKEGFDKTWAAYFPTVRPSDVGTKEYPPPLSDEFWRIYCEPVSEFLKAGRALKLAVDFLSTPIDVEVADGGAWDQTASGIQVLEHLVDPAVPYPAIGSDGRPVERLAAPSLLSSLALMALQDLSGIVRIAKCPCGKLFPSPVPSSEHCSEQCRWKWQKRRKKTKEATTSRR